MRIALFGGSFNPPHVAHQLACAYVLATARPRVDELWMVPTFKHPFDKQLAPFADRVAMCERAAQPFQQVKVSRVEEELGGESYTLRTVEELKRRHPDDQFALVIGADLVAERERWHGWPKLKTLIEFIVVGRGGYGERGLGSPPKDGGAEGPVSVVHLPPISSTDVRRRIAGGEACDSFVDAAVLDYIREKGLYR
jgi:nicotinate-nucleotide adenylyltransferase